MPDNPISSVLRSAAPRRSVDNGSLNPPATDSQTCGADWANTICRGPYPQDPVVNEPAGFDCSGAAVYVTVEYNDRVATRYYDADGNLTWRRAHASESDALSLSQTSAGPVVRVVGHWGWTARYAAGRILLHQAGTLYADADFNATGRHGPHPIEEDFGNLINAICTGFADVTPPMLYAAKCYWPGVTENELGNAAGNATREARRLSLEGAPVTYVGSMLFPDDELVLCLFESSSSQAVKEANERAGIPCERIMQSVWLARVDTERNPS